MSKLTFAALRAANESRAPRWHTSPQGINEWTIGDWFMGMAGEVGEGADELLPLMFMGFVGKVGALGNMAKKYRRVQEGIANKSADPARLVADRDTFLMKAFEEIADVQIYLDLFALRIREHWGFKEDIGDYVEYKFNKTSELYGFPERIINGEFVLVSERTLDTGVLSNLTIPRRNPYRVFMIVAEETEPLAEETALETMTFDRIEVMSSEVQKTWRLAEPLKIDAGTIYQFGVREGRPVIMFPLRIDGEGETLQEERERDSYLDRAAVNQVLTGKVTLGGFKVRGEDRRQNKVKHQFISSIREIDRRQYTDRRGNTASIGTVQVNEAVISEALREAGYTLGMSEGSQVQKSRGEDRRKKRIWVSIERRDKDRRGQTRLASDDIYKELADEIRQQPESRFNRRTKDRRHGQLRFTGRSKRMGNRRGAWKGVFEIIQVNDTSPIKLTHTIATIASDSYAVGAAAARFVMGIADGKKFECQPALNPEPADKISTQVAEFDAVAELAKAYDILTRIAPVDDDYPLFRGRYTSRLMELLRRLKDNGHTLPPWK